MISAVRRVHGYSKIAKGATGLYKCLEISQHQYTLCMPMLFSFHIDGSRCELKSLIRCSSSTSGASEACHASKVALNIDHK